MAESKHTQITAALKARFAGIVGDGGAAYWYTPDRVIRCVSFERLTVDPSVGDQIVAIRPGEESHSEETTGGGTGALAEFYVLLVRKTAATEDNPYGPDGELKSLEQDRMTRDFLRALLLDPTLGGLVNNVIDGSLIVDRGVDVEGFTCVEARFTVSYSYEASAP